MVKRLLAIGLLLCCGVVVAQEPPDMTWDEMVENARGATIAASGENSTRVTPQSMEDVDRLQRPTILRHPERWRDKHQWFPPTEHGDRAMADYDARHPNVSRGIPADRFLKGLPPRAAFPLNGTQSRTKSRNKQIADLERQLLELQSQLEALRNQQ